MAHANLAPRLLTKKQAAAYLGYASAEVMDHLAIAPIRLREVGSGSAPRYDRLALDNYIDSLSGSPDVPQASVFETEAEAALGEWMASRATLSA